MNKKEVKKRIQLTTEPLDTLIKDGESIDFRLDQDIWSTLKVGDLIEFWEDFTGWQKEPTEESRRVVVKINKIYKADKFSNLFKLIEDDSPRLGDKESLLKDMRKWWTEEKESHEGVLAWYVVVV